MKNLIKMITALAVTFCLCTHASATMIIDLYGDKDGFGIPGGESIADGDVVDLGLVGKDPQDPADVGTITDQLTTGTQSWTHSYDLTGLGPVISVELEIFTAGQGLAGLSTLWLDGIEVGTLSDGQTGSNGNTENLAQLDIYQLSSSLISRINGSDRLEVRTVSTADGWALDYSELRIETASVPEPTTLSLVALGFLGMGFFRTRRRLHSVASRQIVYSFD